MAPKSCCALSCSQLLLLATLLGALSIQTSQAKESINWDDFGVSLAASPKSSGQSSNLRVLVSPQRRMIKNYEFEYTNNSQPASVQPETSYVLPGGSGNSYSSVTSLSSPHSSAYSALSASLATLKSRLNARGVSLQDPGSQSSMYAPNSHSTYGASIIADSQAGSSHSQHGGQSGSQPTYLSMSSGGQQEAQANYGSSVGSSQSGGENSNKTIVLAIPAKINFLTENRSTVAKQSVSQPTQMHQAQPQMTVVQSSGEPQPSRPIEYTGTSAIDQYGGQTYVRETNGDQDHHQYVIVNSPASQPQVEQPVQMSAGAGPMYQNIYPTMRYAPAYAHPQGVVESQQVEPVQISRLSSCLDTCNSADPRWRKHSVSKYKACCSRSSQYDASFEQPSVEKLGETSDSTSKQIDDAYYNYLYRRSRSRRSRRPRNRYHSNRYSASSSAGSSNDDEGAGADSAAVDSPRSSGRSSTSSSSYNSYESPYMKYYRSSRQQSHDTPEMARDVPDTTAARGARVSSRDRSYRRGRSRDFSDAPESHPSPSTSGQHDSTDEDTPYTAPEAPTRGSSGYGSGEYSVDAGRYPADTRGAGDEEEPSGRDEAGEQDSRSAPVGAQDGAEYSGPEQEGAGEDQSEYEAPANYRQAASRGRRKPAKTTRSKKAGKEAARTHYKKGRKVIKHSKQTEQASSQVNGTDYEYSQAGDHYHPDTGNSEDEQSAHQKEPENLEANQESDKGQLAKYKAANLSDSTVAHLSKTTMHLKEILSLLERKAQLKMNETSQQAINQQPQQQAQQQQQVTSTPAPMTTTSSLYPLSLLGSQYSASGLSNDYLTSDLSLKSPYRLDASSLSTFGSPSLSSLASSYGSLSQDAISSLASFPHNQYGLPPNKHMGFSSGHPPRKRRPNKNIRYNGLMMPKTHGLSASTSSLLQAAGKSSLLNPAYYPSLQYPYWYPRSASSSITNSYPYKNLSKSPYSPMLASASKLSGVSSLYTDALHGYDPLSTVASSLRPSASMRLRQNRPFVFQPQVLPIYTRHTILSPQLDKKA